MSLFFQNQVLSTLVQSSKKRAVTAPTPIPNIYIPFVTFSSTKWSVQQHRTPVVSLNNPADTPGLLVPLFFQDQVLSESRPEFNLPKTSSHASTPDPKNLYTFHDFLQH